MTFFRNIGHVMSLKGDTLQGTLILITFLKEVLKSILSVISHFFFLQKGSRGYAKRPELELWLKLLNISCMNDYAATFCFVYQIPLECFKALEEETLADF